VWNPRGEVQPAWGFPAGLSRRQATPCRPKTAPPSLERVCSLVLCVSDGQLFRLLLSARHSARNESLQQFTALTWPSPLPFATAVSGLRNSADARAALRAATVRERSRLRSPTVAARFGSRTARKKTPATLFTPPAGVGCGIWVRVGGRPPKRWVSAWPGSGGGQKECEEKDPLRNLVQSTASPQVLAKTLTTKQIAYHVLR
jgi:hypothetical protein